MRTERDTLYSREDQEKSENYTRFKKYQCGSYFVGGSMELSIKENLIDISFLALRACFVTRMIWQPCDEPRDVPDDTLLRRLRVSHPKKIFFFCPIDKNTFCLAKACQKLQQQCFCGSNVHCNSCSHARIQYGVVFPLSTKFKLAAREICLSFEIGQILRTFTISPTTSTAGRHFGFERDYNYFTTIRACYVIMFKVCYTTFSVSLE